MKILVLIPTKGRAAALKAQTGEWLFKAGIPFKVLIEPQDMNDYWEIPNRLELPENDRGLEYSLYQGKLYAEQNGYDTIFKIDDDVDGWIPLFDKNNKTNTNRFLEIIEDIEKPLASPNCGGVSFGYRQEFWHDKVWFGVNQRFQTCYVVKTDLWKPTPAETGKAKTDPWQDFCDFLRVIDKGYKVIRYGRYVMDTRVGVGEGGLDYWYNGRTPEQYKELLDAVSKEFPWLTFRQKPNGLIEPNMDSPVIGGKRL